MFVVVVVDGRGGFLCDVLGGACASETARKFRRVADRDGVVCRVAMSLNRAVARRLDVALQF